MTQRFDSSHHAGGIARSGPGRTFLQCPKVEAKPKKITCEKRPNRLSCLGDRLLIGAVSTYALAGVGPGRMPRDAYESGLRKIVPSS